MANSALALEKIRDHVSKSPVKLRLGQVIDLADDDPSRDEIAGRAVDRVSDVVVTKARSGANLDRRVFVGGALKGTIDCRAVLLEPGVSKRFVGSRVGNALYMRTRLTYEEPGMDTLPRGAALTIGGTVTQVAVHSLMRGDGERLDEYYTRLEKYEAALRRGGDATGTEPEMPALHAYYGLNAPGIPNFDKGETFNPRADERYQLRRLGFDALQDQCPAARVLSVSNQGYISETELMDWAQAFTAPQEAPAAAA